MIEMKPTTRERGKRFISLYLGNQICRHNDVEKGKYKTGQ
jgi:hypothetical protein